ncbi:unnamed protein product [Rotaria magnacalcarata]|uniref:MD-2-related lipid-recognition domain-containing protein n=1 Tax=Rotaria magnacalcarata TaxID=392030 RepID=A0A8S2L305_9BILA|nr:unnamed protein product [Rotaria magnacalcarata]CAF3883341.1 unnamed protein product [Rotaria magnacalcarata]
MQISDPDYFYSKYNLNSDARKEQIFDDFNDTSTSTRSISSISSTTSNGYRNPSQWQFFLSFLTVVITQVTWENCGSYSNDIKLLNLTVNPYPIVAPGSVSINITIYTNQNLTSPLKAILSLRKKTFIGYVPVPCFSIGSCIYKDLCTLCSQCHCPMEAGGHTIDLPITIDSQSWMLAGSYQAQIDLETSLKQKGCAKINNISIKTNK